MKLGIKVFDHQACIFYWKTETDVVIVLLYVDDILITGSNKDKIRETVKGLNKVFNLKVLWRNLKGF